MAPQEERQTEEIQLQSACDAAKLFLIAAQRYATKNTAAQTRSRQLLRDSSTAQQASAARQLPQPVSPTPSLSLCLALLVCPVQVNRRFVLSAFCLLNKMTFISSCIQNCYVAGVDVGSRRQHLK